ncbi:MAG TPA: glycogen debranching enzyme GlgX [Gammaproteobacteria bacterium]|nr:glycogen debranching enzyme GlgX [Gammaproteobacteria bacterium]
MKQKPATACLTHPGNRYPAGATPAPQGVNFSIYSRHASHVELLLFERADDLQPFQVIPLEVRTHRTFFFWHVFVIDLPAGTHYAWRIDGPDDVHQSGFRFDREKVLLDPWVRGMTDSLWQRAAAEATGSNMATSMRGVVPSREYDWEDDETLGCIRPERTVIYEMHVGGFTRHPGSGVSRPGTFLGVIEKIPYLMELGVTHVELMPVMAFDEQDVPAGVAELGLGNFWGYSTHSYFSPHPGYCVSPDADAHASEFRDMVKALHEAGIGVILDVVFNHTAEGGAGGPVINFKGIGNETFYHLDPGDRSRYRDYTGCGNTVNCNHPLVARFIMECLEYWVREMHVDGFRFDLASVLSRGENGKPLYHAPVLWNIEFSNVLSETRIIAEAWDAAGLYQVGDFPGFRWGEWNGQYRDVVRRFVRGDKGMHSELARRFSGNSDLYQDDDRQPINSINFISCHDGFTLHDMVSYNEKHNEGNGENNRDGSRNSLSWNCGTEGETDDEDVLALRRQQAKNFMAILMLSQGIPMINAGDEVLRTQHGNNNVWCQNNELGWFDWSLTETNGDMLRFTRQMIAFRKRHACLMHTRFLNGLERDGQWFPDITWHSDRLDQPLWEDPDTQMLACTLGAVEAWEEDLFVIMNMQTEQLVIPLPRVAEGNWHLAIDTAGDTPLDIIRPADQPVQAAPAYVVQPRSVVVFERR